MQARALPLLRPLFHSCATTLSSHRTEQELRGTPEHDGQDDDSNASPLDLAALLTALNKTELLPKFEV